MLSDSFIKDNVKFVFVDEKNIQYFKNDYIYNSDCLIEIRVKKAFLDDFLLFITSVLQESNLSSLGMTEREIEVLKYLSAGLNNQQISKLMNISIHTTKAHIHSIFNKLSVQGRTEAAVKAIKDHLINL